MRIGINQFCWPSQFDVVHALEMSAKMGYQVFEVCMTPSRPSASSIGGVSDALDISGYYNRLLNEEVGDSEIKKLKSISDQFGIPIASVGGIMSFSIYSLISNDSQIAQRGEDALKRMIDAAYYLGADTVLVIAGMVESDMDYQRSYEKAQASIHRLAQYAKEGVQLGVENVWNNMLYSPLELARFVDEIGMANVGIYFDVANARRFGYPEQWIRTLGHRIKKLHLKDYRMSVDNIHGFTNLLDGDVNYPAVIQSLRDIEYDGDLVVELIPPAHHFVEETLQYAQRVVTALIKS